MVRRCENWLVGQSGWLVDTAPATYMWCAGVPWNGGNGTRVRAVDCGYYANRRVWIAPAGPIASGVPGKCMDDAGNLATDGAKVDIWTCYGSAAQRWTIEPDGTVRIQVPRSDRRGRNENGAVGVQRQAQPTVGSTSCRSWLPVRTPGHRPARSRHLLGDPMKLQRQIHSSCSTIEGLESGESRQVTWPHCRREFWPRVR